MAYKCFPYVFFQLCYILRKLSIRNVTRKLMQRCIRQEGEILFQHTKMNNVVRGMYHFKRIINSIFPNTVWYFTEFKEKISKH